MNVSYHIRFGSTDYSPTKMRHVGAILGGGETLLLPMRAFALGSSGYTLQPGESSGEVLVQHAFAHTWNLKGAHWKSGGDSTAAAPEKVSTKNDLKAAGTVPSHQTKAQVPPPIIRNTSIVSSNYKYSFQNSCHIPPILHQTWKSRNVPGETAQYMKSWRKFHPEWQYRFSTDEDNMKFMAKYYPEWLPMFKAYPKAIQRADAIRYFLLNTFGGVYVDLDFEALRPLEGFLQNQSCLVGQVRRKSSTVV